MPSVNFVDFQEPTVNAQWLNNIGQAIFTTINVRMPDYGCYGDGVHDDYPGLLAAFTAALATPGGVRVHIPAGTYNMSQGINIPLTTNQAFIITGDGHATKIRYTGPTTGTPLFSVGGGSPVFGAPLVVNGLGFIQQTGAGQADFVSMHNVNSSTFTSCYLYNGRNGILLNDSYNTVIDKCFFYGHSANGVSTLVTGTNSLIVRDSVFNTNVTGINLLVGGNNIAVTGCDLEGNGVDIGMTNYTSVRIAENYCENGTGPAFFFGGTNQMVDIEQNWFGARSVATNLGGVISGNFRKNTLFQSVWQTNNGTGKDFIVGANTLLTGATLETSEWTIPALSNGFTTQGNCYDVQYIKNEDNLVTVRGNTLNGATNALAFNIPAGYRPTKNQAFATASTSGPGTSIVEVRSNGDFYCILRDGTGGCGWNFSYYAEQ